MINRFIYFWNHLPDHITPHIIQFGQFQIRYYGLMYIVAFTIVYLLSLYRVKDEDYSFSKDTIQDSFVWMILGLMLGGRLGYVLFYSQICATVVAIFDCGHDPGVFGKCCGFSSYAIWNGKVEFINW